MIFLKQIFSLLWNSPKLIELFFLIENRAKEAQKDQKISKDTKAVRDAFKNKDSKALRDIFDSE